MARPQVREVSAPSAIQGVAAPVPTYVRPADPGRSPLHDLAEGLAAFDAGLGAFLNKRKGENDEAEKARALVDFDRNNQMGWAEAVRQGKVPAHASPVYMEWYKKRQGDLAGLKLRDKFALDYQSWEGRYDADSGTFGQWYSQWVAQNIGDDQDPHVLEGLAPHLDSLLDGSYDTFMKEREARVREGARATSGALITDALETTLDDGRSSGTTDWETFWGRTMELREEALGRGELAEDYDQLIVDSILLQAERTADMEVLQLLDKTLPGSQHPLNYDPKVRDAMTKTQDRVRAAQGAMASDLARERERIEKQQQEELWAEALDRIHKGEEVPEEFIVRLSRRDGEARAKMARYQKEAVELGTQEDPEALLDIYTQIDQGAGVDFILRMREQGVIRDPTTLTKALDRVKAAQNALKDGGIFTSPTYKDTVKFITEQTGDDRTWSFLGGSSLSSEGMEALYDYRQMLLDWESRNPNASLFEKEKAAREMGDHIRRQMVDDPERGNAKQYISETDRAELERQAAEEAAAPSIDQPAEEEAPNPFGGYSFIPNPIQSFREWWNGPQQPEEARQGGVEAPVVAPEPRVEQSPAPALESLSEARRSAVESLAARKGISVEDANQQLHDKLMEIMGEQGIDRETTRSISQESRDSLANLFENPPQAEDTPLATAYVDPKSNPNVASDVLERFAGKRLPVSIRNNNMGAVSITGDIKSSWAAKQPGFVGATKRPAAEGGHYAKYATPEHGVAAASRLLERYGQQGINTPEAIVKKWSTDTKAHGAYARTLSKYLTESGIEAGVDTPLDLTDPKVRIAVLKAKSAHESGAGVPVYADAVFERGANYRLGNASGEKPRGLAALAPNGLVASSKRGYKPDLENLKPEIRTGVESLQKAWGRELPIVSGFRDPARNKKAGGAKRSENGGEKVDHGSGGIVPLRAA